MARRIPGQSVATRAVCGLLAAALAFAASALTPDQQAIVDHISENSLRGHLSFIASDSLEGRATPSRGLDLAAEYIAAQFRRAGLESASGDDYFQTAPVPNGMASNVAGLLRGSDPALSKTYVILSAHYDHVGTRPTGEDRIFNGANDDGSGTVSVIEIAAALAASPTRTKRSILFLALFGEERGFLGSRYYVEHPLEPLDKTVAEVNLEQIGRTDTANGRQLGVMHLTGYDYSNLAEILDRAAEPTSVRVTKESGEYFDRSDNLSFARAGVLAHTIYVAAEYSDYHAVGDEWQKLDYANMSKIDRGIALGLLALASDAPAPKWNSALPATRRYVDAAQKLHAQ